MSRCAWTRRSVSSKRSALRVYGPNRHNDEVRAAFAKIGEAGRGTDNLPYPMKEALQAKATVGEVCNALRDVWGLYQSNDAF